MKSLQCIHKHFGRACQVVCLQCRLDQIFNKTVYVVSINICEELCMVGCFLAASVKSVKSEKDMPIASMGDPMPSHLLGLSHHPSHQQQVPRGPSRHLIYATHMPIPQVSGVWGHLCSTAGSVCLGFCLVLWEKERERWRQADWPT